MPYPVKDLAAVQAAADSIGTHGGELFPLLLKVGSELSSWQFVINSFTLRYTLLSASNRITPVFAISSVTGLGVDLLRNFVGERLYHLANNCC